MLAAYSLVARRSTRGLARASRSGPGRRLAICLAEAHLSGQFRRISCLEFRELRIISMTTLAGAVLAIPPA